MRNTKFKVYDYDTKTMYTQEDLMIIFDEVGEDIIIHKGALPTPLYNYELLQYIGSNDIVGNEIYEGDIIKRTDLTPIKKYYGKEDIGVVKYKNTQFVLETSEDKYYAMSSNGTFYLNMANYEVIGNIYETPQLLQRHENVKIEIQ